LKVAGLWVFQKNFHLFVEQVFFLALFLRLYAKIIENLSLDFYEKSYNLLRSMSWRRECDFYVGNNQQNIKNVEF